MGSMMRWRKLGTPRAVLLIFVGLTSLAILLQTAWAIFEDRRNTLASERENGLVAVRLLEEHAQQQLAAASLRLDTVSNGVQAISQDKSGDAAAIHNVIEETLKNSRSAGALQFAGLQGERWVSTMDFPSYVFNTEERDYIAWLLQRPQYHSVTIGSPLQRFIDAELVLPLARNLYDRHGRHVGLISTEVSLSYFNTVYDRVAKDSQAIVQLLSDNDQVIVSSASSDHGFKQNILPAAVSHALRSSAVEGSFEASLSTNEQRLYQYTYRKVSGFPITTLFGRELNKILINWQARTRDRLFFSSAFIVFHLLLTWYLILHMDKLQRSENRLRASESRFVDLFQSSPVPLALIAVEDDVLIEVNNALLLQFGYTRLEFLGRTPAQLALWKETQARSPYLQQLRTQTYVDNYEALLQHKNGQIITCLLSARMLESEGQKVVIFSPIDISRQREVESEIRQLNEQLEQRVAERTVNLQDALSSITAMQSEIVRTEKMAALGMLVAGVAHELNTPLGNSLTASSSMEAYTDNLLEELKSERPRRSVLNSMAELIHEGGFIVTRNLERAATLVASFKQVAADQSSDCRRCFDLQQVLQELIVTIEPMFIKQHQLYLQLEAGINMDSYPGALVQIITNLVSNAIVHGFEGRILGNMHLRSRLLPDDEVELSFSDDGLGIAPEHLGRIFDPFFTTKLGQGGSGLGMNIVYNLVTTTLEGSIKVESSVNAGANILIRLPLKVKGKLTLGKTETESPVYRP
ncbi:ATP-binding protein [Undibacterium sp. Di27W]|uniref:ATP-binding protein n=1 Tax=Undibacterium sp. Di27W TaxID=3413036 RepID=UPI003BF06272